MSKFQITKTDLCKSVPYRCYCSYNGTVEKYISKKPRTFPFGSTRPLRGYIHFKVICYIFLSFAQLFDKHFSKLESRPMP